MFKTIKSIILFMKKLHWTVFFIIISCIGTLGFLTYIAMVKGLEVPSYLIAALTSIASGLIGYSAGKGESSK